jgi:hypothetical protein
MANGSNLSGQLRMFMSPREIKREYQPLDADREDPSQWGESSRSLTTGTATRNAARSAIPSGSNPFIAPARAMNRNIQHGYREDDAALWERKAEEADELYDPPLQRSIAERGVLNPVQLSTNQLGSQGKQQVVGGHHRIAAAHDVDPDMLIPVLHHTSITAAKNHPYYPYEAGKPDPYENRRGMYR